MPRCTDATSRRRRRGLSLTGSVASCIGIVALAPLVLSFASQLVPAAFVRGRRYGTSASQLPPRQKVPRSQQAPMIRLAAHGQGHNRWENRWQQAETQELRSGVQARERNVMQAKRSTFGSSRSGLTTVLLSRRSLRDVLNTIVDANERISLNIIHVAAAWSVMLEYVDEMSPHLLRHQGFEELEWWTRRLLTRRDATSQELSTLLQAAATFGDAIPWLQDEIVPIALELMEEQAAKATPPSISNSIWALGQLQLQDEQANTTALALADAAQHSLRNFYNQELAVLAWGLQTGGWNGTEEVCSRLAKVAELRVPSMDDMEVKSVLPRLFCALVKSDVHSKQLLDTVAARMLKFHDRNSLAHLKQWQLAALTFAWAKAQDVNLDRLQSATLAVTSRKGLPERQRNFTRSLFRKAFIDRGFGKEILINASNLWEKPRKERSTSSRREPDFIY